MKITINSTGEVLNFPNGREAVEVLSGRGVIPAPTSDKYNPTMLLHGPVKRGVITVHGEGVQTSIPSNPINNPLEAFAGLLQGYMQPSEVSVNMDEVRELINEAVKDIEDKFNTLVVPRKLEVKIGDRAPVLMDEVLHPKFETLLTALCCPKIPGVWLAGPAGSGKTTAAEQAARCLTLPFYTISVCSQSTKSDLFGYMNASGEYVPSLFYQAYKHGGVFLLDEVDNGNANVLSALNAALSNGHCAFPCGMVSKHPDFKCIAGGNTIGTGATLQYNGRNPIDGATLNRFFFIRWGYDEKNEGLISGNPEFTSKIQSLRKKAEDKGLRVIISPRASIYGASLLELGMSEDEILEGLIFAGMNENDCKTLRG